MSNRRTSSAQAGLHLDYVPCAELAMWPASSWESVLGVVGFGKPPVIEGARVPVTASMTPSLGGSWDLCEVWRVLPPSEVSPALSNGVIEESRLRYRYSEDLLFGSITVDELGTDAAGLQQATEAAYQQIFAVLQGTEHRHLIRIWNYLPEINRETDGDERYRHFNSARQSAFRNSGRSTVGTVPAACALGSPAGSPISIYFLASRLAPTMIENPRQTSAYHYPLKFGKDSPTFSRACVMSESAGTTLFVSGTASIVGYETIHRGDVAAQTRETLVNINALIDEANRVVGSTSYAMDDLKLKVYLRQPSDLRAVSAALDSELRPSTPIVYLQADVCREDLLVEIEATG